MELGNRVLMLMPMLMTLLALGVSVFDVRCSGEEIEGWIHTSNEDDRSSLPTNQPEDRKKEKEV